jgi:hypothetical protein
VVDTKTVSSNGNAGNATFCLRGTGTHSGSYSGSNVKWNTKEKKVPLKKIKKEMTTFWETTLLLTIKREDLVQVFFPTVLNMVLIRF